MPSKKTPKRLQTETIQARVTPDVKAELEAARVAAEADLQKTNPGARLGIGPWLVGLGLREARKKR